MLDKFRSILKSNFENLERKEVFLAISGGKDSMALSHLLLNLKIPHTLLHCNFQLRGNDSDADENFVKVYAEQHKLPIHIKRFDTTTQAELLKLSIQETARKLRYDWFDTFSKSKNHVILTAHHADDSIETFFINLMRGTGLKGLTGIPERNKRIWRPLLSFSSQEIIKYIDDNEVSFRTDQSNYDNKYLRNHVRNVIIPEFEEKTDRFKFKINTTIESLFEVNSWIEDAACTFKKLNFKRQKTDLIQIEKRIVKNQKAIFLEYLLKEYGVHRSNLNSFDQFLNGRSGSQFLTEDFIFSIDNENIYLRKKIESGDFISKSLSDKNDLPFSFLFNDSNYSLRLSETLRPFNGDNIQQINAEELLFPLTIRKWKNGDKIRPLGMKGTKLISDILIDRKIPLHEKQNILVLEDNKGTILAIPGLLISDSLKIGSDSITFLQIIKS